MIPEKVKKEIKKYIQDAYFDPEIFKNKDMIVENVIEYLIQKKIIPERPTDRPYNDQLIEFIKKQLKQLD